MAIDMDQELKRTTDLRGFRFGLHDFVAKLKGADALKKHNDAIEASYLKQGLLDKKTKELAIVVAGHAPLLVVVGHVQGVRAAPRASPFPIRRWIHPFASLPELRPGGHDSRASRRCIMGEAAPFHGDP